MSQSVTPLTASSAVVAAALALLGVSNALASPATSEQFVVRYETEAPGMQTTSATFSTVGRESFDAQRTGTGQSYTTDFGTGGVIRGTYTNLEVRNADQYGGAYGTGRYPVTFERGGYEISLSTSLPGGVNYFGYWLSALDANNYVTFYRGADSLFEFTPADLLAMVKGKTAYYGNPNANFAGKNMGEPYAFVDFFDEGGYFDRIVFRQAAGGGYESDNHTVGRYLTQGTGTLVGTKTVTAPPATATLVTSPVPEPSGVAMVLAGLGMVVPGLPRRQRAG